MKYYITQAKESKDDYIARVLVEMAEVEFQHVSTMRDIIIQLGGKPFYLDKEISTLFGKCAGYTSAMIGTVNMFKINVLIETRAQQDYLKTIKACTDKEIVEILWKHAIQEDQHRAWFQEQQDQLRKLFH